MIGRWAALAAVAVSIGLASGCGSSGANQSAVSAPGVTSSYQSQASYDPDALMRSNTAYRDYRPATPQAQAAANALVPKVTAALKRIRAHPPVTESSVQATLHAALPTLNVTASSAAARVPEGIGYAVTVETGTSVGCVHGWVSARSQAIAVSGPTGGEGCLPLLGH
jgi:hypothetical protein